MLSPAVVVNAEYVVVLQDASAAAALTVRGVASGSQKERCCKI